MRSASGLEARRHDGSGVQGEPVRSPHQQLQPPRPSTPGPSVLSRRQLCPPDRDPPASPWACPGRHGHLPTPRYKALWPCEVTTLETERGHRLLGGPSFCQPHRLGVCGQPGGPSCPASPHRAPESKRLQFRSADGSRELRPYRNRPSPRLVATPLPMAAVPLLLCPPRVSSFKGIRG